MKKKLLFLTLVLTNVFLVFSQGEANIWYFGQNAGLDFNSGSPVAITDGQLNTLEGCATISNSAGQLLFYTDGITVWDKNHTIMPNGTGLQGDPSSSQSGIIVPYPNQPNLYYVFCVRATSADGGLFYSVVDLSLNGGNGDIVPGQKNILLLQRSAEKIAAINDDGNGFWVISYAGPNGTEFNYNTYHAYRITDTGIDVNSIRSTYNDCSSSDGRGYLKISPDSQKIINCNQDFNHVCYHRFDNVTGAVSSEVAQLGILGDGYCAEFSLNSTKVYVSSGNISASSSYLFQFDLNATNIQASRVQIHTEVQERGALQLGVDGKIYYARPDRPYVGVINNPEADGAACNYVNQGVDLAGRQCKQGLPPFIQSFFNVGIEVSENCLGDPTIFSVNSNEAIVSIMWNFGDGNTSTVENPSHTYATPGNYTVSVTATSSNQSISLSRDITVYENPTQPTISDYIVCDDMSNDNIEMFDLSTKDAEALTGQPSGSTFAVSYYETMDDAVNDVNPLSTNYNSTNDNQSIYARVYNVNNPDCYEIANFQLLISEAATQSATINFSICDSFNDGQETISLTQFNSQILDTQSSSLFDIYYYETAMDATDDMNRISTNHILQSDFQTLYARKENDTNTLCFTVSEIVLALRTSYTANPVEDMIICDDVSNDGIELFNLSLQNDGIADGQLAGYSITYHISQADADSDSNALSTNFMNDFNPQEIFVRIENNDEPNCYDTTSFFIEVKPVPNVNTEEIITYVCTNETVMLIADSGYDEYLWSSGEMTQAITVSEAGIYTVSVTTNYNSSPEVSCSNTQTFRVIESDEAVITDISIQDWTLYENQFEVFVEGIGDYEYSINGFDYQDSPVFTNLSPGNVTVFVRDKNGCGVVSQLVNLLFYPGFFTPNNDGYNDFWQIISSEYEPDLRIHIFNRYGKLLTIIDPESQGWDGNYRGRQLPSDDYWFMVERPSNGETYTGHFTLKR
ncbi:T9SS type B sorting domain-containing protein [Kordia zhangzhouensis]|uniref:T9SS type B sorting domain-containing protein n=1 Tax=Kordia zhangzhouensis TaxID=1620405 RepID=UPI0006299187|nr:T9SS C-terminal target domain-containing protein [Kordia zhangzhouensis]